MEIKKYRGIERRKFLRLEVPVQVKVTIMADDEMLGGPKTLSAKSRNISMEGICIETRQVEIDGVHILSGSPRSEKNQLQLQIDLSPEEKPIEVLGEVCWYDLSSETEEFMFQVGIVFLNITADAKKTLKNYLKAHSKPGGNIFTRIIKNL